MRQTISLFSFFCAVFFAIYGSLQAQELTNALEFFPTDLMNPDAEIVDFSSLQAAPEDVPDPAEPEVTELNTIQDFWKLSADATQTVRYGSLKRISFSSFTIFRNGSRLKILKSGRFPSRSLRFWIHWTPNRSILVVSTHSGSRENF